MPATLHVKFVQPFRMVQCFGPVKISTVDQGEFSLLRLNNWVRRALHFYPFKSAKSESERILSLSSHLSSKITDNLCELDIFAVCI